MFTSLHALAKRGTLSITITAEGDEQLRVNVTPMPFDSKAKANLPQPLSLVATPAEFDAEFAGALATWQAPKRSLTQQVLDATGGQAGAADAPKLPAPKDMEKAKPGRKPRSDKSTDGKQASAAQDDTATDGQPGDASASSASQDDAVGGAVPAGVQAAGEAAGAAAAAADQAMAGEGDAAASASTAPAGDKQAAAAAPVATGDGGAAPSPASATAAPAAPLVDADGFEKIDTKTLDLF